MWDTLFRGIWGRQLNLNLHFDYFLFIPLSACAPVSALMNDCRCFHSRGEKSQHSAGGKRSRRGEELALREQGEEPALRRRGEEPAPRGWGEEPAPRGWREEPAPRGRGVSRFSLTFHRNKISRLQHCSTVQQIWILPPIAVIITLEG